MSKRELRRAIRPILAGLLPQEVSVQSVRVAEVLQALPQWRSAHQVALYLHMDRELQTTEMLRAAFDQDKRVFLPKIVPLGGAPAVFPTQKTRLEMLEVKSLEEVLELAPQGKYQIREPLDGTNCYEAGGLDLVVVPGVAFTADGARMGHGAGYYDTFIEEHLERAGRVPVLVGVCFAQQVVAQIPLEAHDRRMDKVVHGGEYI